MTTQISVKLLRTCFESEFYPDLFVGKQTDDPTWRLVGQLAFYTQDPALIRRVVESGLPPKYEGDTLDRLDDMIERTLENYQESGNTAEAKTSPSGKLVSLVEDAPGIELFHNGFEDTFISIIEEEKGIKIYPLMSSAAQRWLKYKYYSAVGRPISSSAFREAHETLIAKARYEGVAKSIFLRLARIGKLVVINLANDNGEAVTIDSTQWALNAEPPVSFVKSASMASLPSPAVSDGSAFMRFKQLMGLSDNNFHRVLAFLINCLKPEGPYLLLLLEGEQGSGKSVLSEFIKRMIDPSQARNVRLPESSRDLMIQATESHLIVFDNVSGIKNEISDALCTLSTGGGYATRKLYTDDELKVFDASRPFILNGINGVASRPDLLERSLSLKLPQMPKEKHQTEEELRAQFLTLLPELLGELYGMVSCALREFDEIETPKGIRMADAAKWLAAAEPATGLPEGSLLAALRGSQSDIIIESMSNNAIAIALVKTVQLRPFDGTMGDLFMLMESYRPKHDRFYPATSSHLSRQLERIRPALKVAGIEVEFGPKTRAGKRVKVSLSEDGEFSDLLNTTTEWKPGIEI